jgi:signal transduction histidine kinase
MAAAMLVAVQAMAQSGGNAYMGIPFFTNYSAGQYDAHNRNFDVLCDDEGRTYFANFEGLLVYDQVDWKIVHTPDISRVVSLHRDADGTVLFDGINLMGRVEAFEGDSIRVSYTQLAEVATASTKDVDRWNEIEVYQRLKLSEYRTLLATATEGVIAVDAQGKEIWRINVDNGLCSNSITKLAYDGKGTVWGATDNGVFSISVSEIYTHFTEKEGLRGQISCISMCGSTLMVGTFQGLFRLEGQKFVPVSNINHACWQMAQGAGETLYVTTSDGLYEYSRGTGRQLTTQFSLSIAALPDGSYLVGELERVCRFRPGEGSQVIDAIPNITSFKKDERGMWAMTLAGDYYFMTTGSKTFEKKDLGPISKLFEYEDPAGNVWRSNSNGLGISFDDVPEDLKNWIEPFAEWKVNAMLVQDGLVWIGDYAELVRFNMDQCGTTAQFVPQLHIRRFSFNDRDLSLSFANDKLDPIGETQYSYRLQNDDTWSKWSEQKEYLFANLNFGNYQVSVRSKDPYGQVSETGPFEFRRPYPFYMRWYSLLVYILIIVFIVYLIFRYRMRRMAEEQQRLEAIVDERTRELRSAQDQLLRQEREAAIGKLTKGLIDRILNPMNYINNFAHLTLGLNKEMAANIEDEKDNLTPDTYEDALDVMDMMKTNLEKIEQHGISTTRTLKAMEEMLKERSRKFELADLALLCQQCVEKFKNYNADDISAFGVQVECVRPDAPIMRDVVADQISKSVMSMLTNSIYAIRKKAEKGGSYQPVIRLTISQALEGAPVLIKIYDNGIGIEQSIMGKIFDPFFTTKPTAEAPGVGLYLSQQILHDCGGSITVDSVKDEYTEFVINLA